MIAAIERPAPSYVDGLVKRYSEAQAEVREHSVSVKAAQEKADELKTELVALVQQFGIRHTQKSRKLCGNHSTAMVTIGTRVSVDSEAVESFRLYLHDKNLGDVSPRFFTEHVSYQLVDGPQEVLKTLNLGARIRTKISGLLGQCFQVKTNAPILKVDLVEATRLA